MLDDGAYDVLVIDAARDDRGVTVELTILAGAHKGEVVAVRAVGIEGDVLDLLGQPGTLNVHDGKPSVTFDH